MFVISVIDPSLGEQIRVVYIDKNDRARLRCYAHLSKHTHSHSHTQIGVIVPRG